MSGTAEVASVAGPAIEPLQYLDVVIPWTPSQQGRMTIYGKVVLPGDQNTINDNTASLDVTVMPAGTIGVTIGDRAQTARMPVDMYYKNSLYETIYLASKITGTGIITSLTFYNNFVTNLPNKPTKIWLPQERLPVNSPKQQSLI